ncbi:MAG: crossover junction endodeoxyribonuclease RuvC [Thermoanaerobaculia bacterium]|nr:crossover junction endodeoxyribonuclease RuvC [Thermoanaerobaculia bacterium]
MRILGLDPGSRHTGFGCIEPQGSSCRVLTQGRISCPSGESLPERLARLAEDLDELVQRWDPAIAALEKPFHGVNPRSLIVLAQARGVLLATLAARSIPVEEYAPAEVKSAVTGNGRASKDQVSRMVRMLTGVDGDSLSEDAADALAVALCFAARRKWRGATKG